MVRYGMAWHGKAWQGKTWRGEARRFRASEDIAARDVGAVYVKREGVSRRAATCTRARDSPHVVGLSHAIKRESRALRRAPATRVHPTGRPRPHVERHKKKKRKKGMIERSSVLCLRYRTGTVIISGGREGIR